MLLALRILQVVVDLMGIAISYTIGLPLEDGQFRIEVDPQY